MEEHRLEAENAAVPEDLDMSAVPGNDSARQEEVEGAREEEVEAANILLEIRFQGRRRIAQCPCCFARLVDHAVHRLKIRELRRQGEDLGADDEPEDGGDKQMYWRVLLQRALQKMKISY